MYDADIDAIMRASQDAPGAVGRVTAKKRSSSRRARLRSVLCMAVLVNYVAAALLALTIGFYLFRYHMWLKRLTGCRTSSSAVPPAHFRR